MRKTWYVHFIFIALLIIAADSHGQYRLGDGHRLDNNLQRGSGGRNTPVNDGVNNRINNAIITGNVGGLRGFQDDVGYNDVTEFGDRLGSDDLFDFRRRTADVNPYVNPQLAPARSQTIFLRNGTSTNTGLITNQTGVQQGPQLVIPGQSTDLTSNINFLGNTSETRQYADPLRVDLTPEGGVRTAVASPLSGLLIEELNFETPLRKRDRGEPDLRPGELRLSPMDGVDGEGIDLLRGNRPMQDEPGEPGTGPGETTEMDGEVGEPRTVSQQLDAISMDRVEVSPLLTMGQTLGNRVVFHGQDPNAKPEIEDDIPAEGTVDRLLYDQTGEAEYARGQDTYSDVMRRVNEKSVKAKGDDEQGLPWDLQVFRSFFQDDAADVEVEDPTKERTPLDELFDTEELAELTDEERAAIESPIFDEEPEEDETAKEYANRVRQLEKAYGSLDYDMSPTSNLSGQARSAMHTAVRDGQQFMKEEQYAKAAQSFAAALSVNRQHPLAKAGYIHSTIGAGKYRTAGVELRLLFITNPQLIKYRHAGEALPSASSLEKSKKALRAQLERERSTDLALLLAYIGFQTDDATTTAWALDHWKKSQPRDRLQRALREFWMDEAKSPEQSPEK